jgi:hypothetical protein
MLYAASPERQMAVVLNHVCTAPGVTRDLFLEVIQNRCGRLWNLSAGSRAHLSRLIEEGAWIDAALALSELDSPQWKLRRLVCEDGEWFCSLSKFPCVPLEVDDTADANHADPALAILAAFLEAQRKTLADTSAAQATTAEDWKGTHLDCENFA